MKRQHHPESAWTSANDECVSLRHINYECVICTESDELRGEGWALVRLRGLRGEPNKQINISLLILISNALASARPFGRI